MTAIVKLIKSPQNTVWGGGGEREQWIYWRTKEEKGEHAVICGKVEAKRREPLPNNAWFLAGIHGFPRTS